jgi:hypothetical protein
MESHRLGLRQEKSGRKKRMDKAWWKDVQQVPIFDPEPEESDWRLLFGVNSKQTFHPDLRWADSQWSDHATGVGMLTLSGLSETCCQTSRAVNNQQDVVA